MRSTIHSKKGVTVVYLDVKAGGFQWQHMARRHRSSHDRQWRGLACLHQLGFGQRWERLLLLPLVEGCVRKWQRRGCVTTAMVVVTRGLRGNALEATDDFAGITVGHVYPAEPSQVPQHNCGTCRAVPQPHLSGSPTQVSWGTLLC